MLFLLFSLLLVLYSITSIFQIILPKVQNSDIEKCILMTASQDEFILQTFPHGCFSRAAANTFILETLTHVLHFFL